jgi:NAD(P)-dependent dehydrogenase (short-subunit alcohol dehydrogenase family)
MGRWDEPGGPIRLDGQVAVITGASRGIGFAIAETFIGAGAQVVITGRKPDALRDAEDRLGPAARSFTGSAGDDAVADDTCRFAVETFGRLDILVNGAGTNPQYGPLIDADLGAVDKVLSVNLRAPLVWSQAAWRAAMNEHGGSILNLGSVGGFQPTPGAGAYSISKAGLAMLTRVLAVELGPDVRVNALAPAVVRTKFSEALYRDEEAVVNSYPMHRLGEPADVAQAALYLSSPAASWVTGVVLPLDGGSMAGRPAPEVKR